MPMSPSCYLLWMRATCPARVFLFDFITLTILSAG
jgi:hypothetical protein